jgi:hypothetical protein
MANCCAHDFVDWLAALGPTLATVFAGAATLVVYRRGELFQRQLVRPLVVVRHQVNPGHEYTRWIVQVKNEGQGAANIDAITVVAGEHIIEFDPMESPRDYWQRVLTSLGLASVLSVDGWRIEPPYSMGSGAEQPLFDAHVQGQREEISTAITKLEIRLRVHSSLGERFVIRHRFGHNELL